jgi:arsenite methyltransferase
MKAATKLFKKKDHVKTFWNDFSHYYGETLESSSLLPALSLSKMLKLTNSKNILEVGCGTGTLSLHWLHFLRPNVKYTSIDFSDTMIKIAQERKEAVKHKLNNVDHSFLVGDAEDLSFVPSESIDTYISPLCLHLVPDPNKALAEAVRVTRKGGRIGFSILGPYEKNTFYKLFDDRVFEIVKERPPVPEIPGLGDRENVIELARKAGIKVDYCWEEEVPYDVFDAEELKERHKKSAYAKTFSDASKEVQDKIMEGIKIDFEKAKNSLIPLKTNNLLLVGRKPE